MMLRDCPNIELKTPPPQNKNNLDDENKFFGFENSIISAKKAPME